MFKLNIFIIIEFISIILFVTSNPLFEAIHLCDRKDANFEKCTVDETNRLLKILVNGVGNAAPSLLPYKFSNITYQNDFIIQLLDGHLIGLDTFVAREIKFTWDDNKLIVNGFINRLELQSPCTISGKLIDKSLNGNGSINIILENIDYNGNVFFTFNRKTDNEIYVRTTETKLHMSPKKVKFTFSDILGDSAKEIELNDYLNENDDIARKELVPVVEEVILHYLDIFETNFIGTVPFKNLFINYNYEI